MIVGTTIFEKGGSVAPLYAREWSQLTWSRRGSSWMESSSSRNEVGRRSNAVAGQRLFASEFQIGTRALKSCKNVKNRERISL